MSTPPLLPADQYLASLLGLTADQYRWFKSEAAKRNTIEPGTPVAGLETLTIISLVFTLISVGLTIAASFFKPREQKQGQINVDSDRDPDNITRSQKFAPRYGFDSLQKPAVLGTTIPVVYAYPEQLDASTTPPRPAGRYGGVRLNLQMIWSQMLSLGGDQFLKAIFMVGEANTVAFEGLALGDNPIKSYQYGTDETTQASGKLTVYYRGGGGRITTNDYLLGRSPSTDPGNAARSGGQDVYALLSTGAAYRQDFCFATKPSNSTTFGIYRWFPNDVAYRVNPVFGATGQIDRQARDDGRKVFIEWIDDYNSVATMWKYKYQWSRRCGITSETGIYEVGSTFKYRLYNNSNRDTVIVVNKTNSKEPDAEPDDARVQCTDIADAVASLQNTADENLIVGELYKFGSAIAVLTSRHPDDVFVSEAEVTESNGGREMEYTFTVVRRGRIEKAELTNPTWGTGDFKPPQWFYHQGADLAQLGVPHRWPVVSQRAQGFRCAIATVSVSRACRAFEIGLRSTVGIKINGLCNFKDAKSYTAINDAAGGKFLQNTYPSDKSIGIQQITSGTVTMNEERYSFFKVYIRNGSTEGEFVVIPAAFAVRSNTAQPIYNYLRFFMASNAIWELQFEPMSSWEIRTGGDTDRPSNSPLIVIDYRRNNINNKTFSVLGNVRVEWTGTTVSNTSDTFRLFSIDQQYDKGLGNTDEPCMTDQWGKAAEAFVYDQIQTTVNEGPEHEIVYINTIVENPTAPLYTNLAILGLNIRASNEWSTLAQVSAYITNGRNVARLLNGDTVGPTHLFPDILRDMLLSPVFGMGGVLTEAQIDKASFITAAQWCQDRRYFFDGVIADKVNLRQWAADTAGTMLLELLQRDGKFALQPAILFPESGPVPISGLFTAGNIVENSFSMEFMMQEDRQPIQASVKWREERLRTDYQSSGLFPVEREVLVREISASESDPIESFDLSEYCTNYEHAVDFACYVLRVRRLITHSIKFSTTPDGIDAGLRAGDFIKVALDYTFYDEFANGVILADGTVVSTRPDLLPPGVHNVAYWDGSENPVVDGQITIYSNGLAAPTNVVFVKKAVNSEVRVYKIESIALGENGVIDIEAVHYPVDSAGISLLGKNWTTYNTDTNWVIRSS